jgi:uncharacterized protein (TIGR02099 family)
MGTVLGKILKWLIYAGAAGIMLLALLVGIARLLLPLVPEYQGDIRRWAAEATGFSVQFDNISASWPLAGPQIRFIDVTVTVRETGEPIFVADNLTAGISLFKLIRDRKVVLNRIGVEGSNIRIEHDADKNFLIQGRLLAEYFQFEPAPDEPLSLPDLLIELSAIDVSFADEVRSGDEHAFGIEQLDIRLSTDQITIEGEVEMATEFGGHASISADLPTHLLRREPEATENINPRSVTPSGQEWRIFFTGEELKIQKILEYVLQREVPVTGAHGGITVAVAFNDRVLQGIAGELDIADVVLRTGADQAERFEVLSGQFEWSRQENNGWLLAASDISVELLDLFSPRSDLNVVVKPASDGRRLSVKASAGFLRLQDLYPLVRVAENEGLLTALMSGELQLPNEMQGEVQQLNFSLQRKEDAPDIFGVALKFSNIGVTGLGEGNAIHGVSGTLTADQNGGSLQINAQDTEVALPALLMAPIRVQSIAGLMLWRVTEDAFHIVSDNIRVRTPFLEGNSRFSLGWPRNGDSPQIDLTAAAFSNDVRRVVPLLPLKKFPAPVAAWLDRAIIGGRVPRADIRLSGPLREFPFDGEEGVFHADIDVEDGELDYAAGWPRATNIEAQIVFDGVSLGSRRNNGRVGRIDFRNSDVRIANLRKGLLEINGRQSVPINAALDFVRRSPIAAEIGPVINKVTGVGTIDAELSLAMSILRPAEYDLEIVIDAGGVNLDMTGLDWGLADLGGTLTVRNTKFHADKMTATLLGEPVTIDMHPADESSDLYGQFIRIAGRTPVERWMQTLSVPFAERIAGPADWNALVLFPQQQMEVQPPVHIIVRSDLVGVESRMPDPLAKSLDVPRALEVDVAFPAEGRLEVSGRLHPELTWAFELTSVEQGWDIVRGAVHAGSATAIVPSGEGVEISGRLDLLKFDDWLELAESEEAETGQADWQETWREVILDIDRLTLFGQQFTDIQFEALQDDQDWRIVMESPGIAGHIAVPLDLDSGWPIRLDLQRLWLTDSDPEYSDDDEPADPRDIPPTEVEVADFVINDMHFGSLNMSIKSVAGGVQAEPIRTQAPTFTIDGDGAWLVHPNDDSLRQTRMALTLNGTDIEAALTALDYDPVIDGKSITASSDLTWLGGPTDTFLHRADGTFTISMKEGSILAVDPGGGRILGVLSLASLPRRLSLDFSDVFDEGLGFDSLKGDFTVDDGNAYTCNLGMEGSVADMGVVGRAGFEARDYDQMAVVRPHMSNLLAVGGVVVGGPVGGAAMLLFSQIFQKPLSTLGESYYRISGSWDDPAVEQIRGSDFDVAPLRNCEQYLSDAITESLKEE